MRWTRRIINCGLLTILILLVGCQTPVGVSGSYKPRIPELAAPPLETPCVIERNGVEQWMVCVSVTQHDWITLVTELKAACLALGHSRAECHAED